MSWGWLFWGGANVRLTSPRRYAIQRHKQHSVFDVDCGLHGGRGHKVTTVLTDVSATGTLAPQNGKLWLIYGADRLTPRDWRADASMGSPCEFNERRRLLIDSWPPTNPMHQHLAHDRRSMSTLYRLQNRQFESHTPRFLPAALRFLRNLRVAVSK